MSEGADDSKVIRSVRSAVQKPQVRVFGRGGSPDCSSNTDDAELARLSRRLDGKYNNTDGDATSIFAKSAT